MISNSIYRRSIYCVKGSLYFRSNMHGNPSSGIFSNNYVFNDAADQDSSNNYVFNDAADEDSSNNYVFNDKPLAG